MRETFQFSKGADARESYIGTDMEQMLGPKPWYAYRATEPNFGGGMFKWRSPIHMPRHASRLTLEITDVRVERVQDISESDAIAEGCNRDDGLECECGWLGWEESRGVKRTEGEDFGFLCPKCGELTAHHPLDEQARMEYRKLWDSVNAKRGYGWDKNPWVWDLTFKVAPAS